jgi:hypothetical protein
MKPFDLQAALAGEKVVTRDGRPVKIAGYNPDCANQYALLGWVGKSYLSWYSDGYAVSPHHAREVDLFMAPTERKEWVVVRTRVNSGKKVCRGPFTSRTDAALYACSFPDATIHEITICG